MKVEYCLNNYFCTVFSTVDKKNVEWSRKRWRITVVTAAHCYSLKAKVLSQRFTKTWLKKKSQKRSRRSFPGCLKVQFSLINFFKWIKKQRRSSDLRQLFVCFISVDNLNIINRDNNSVVSQLLSVNSSWSSNSFWFSSCAPVFPCWSFSSSTFTPSASWAAGGCSRWWWCQRLSHWQFNGFHECQRKKRSTT